MIVRCLWTFLYPAEPQQLPLKMNDSIFQNVFTQITKRVIFSSSERNSPNSNQKHVHSMEKIHSSWFPAVITEFGVTLEQKKNPALCFSDNSFAFVHVPGAAAAAGSKNGG